MKAPIWLMAVLPTMASMCVARDDVPGAREKATVEIRFAERVGPMEIDRMALGQGGLSPHPMWESRIAEVRALRPRLVRLFIQEYFHLLPAHGWYDFAALDRSVDTILATGAKPLMCICFKPRALFPKLDQDAVEPTDYAQWDELVTRMVRRYRERGSGIRYWEVANEPDIGEDGGCPYRFQPESYVRSYRHTAAAVLRGDPQARVGGPALASPHSPILPALLDAAEKERLPLHFVSWHIYSSSPAQIGETVEFVRGLLAKRPTLKPETILDEWNMDLMTPQQDPRFQPCFVLETIRQMKEAGLDWSCYYHIRDWHVAEEDFADFMSPHGVAFMARWWNRMPQFDGLFDYQNTVRPTYFAFKLLSRLAGERLRVVSSSDTVHALASHDAHYETQNVLVWNFSPDPVTFELVLTGLPKDALVRRVMLDALAPSSDENARLRPLPTVRLGTGDHRVEVTLGGYGVEYWQFE